MNVLTPEQEKLIDSHERYGLRHPNVKGLCALIRDLARRVEKAEAAVNLGVDGRKVMQMLAEREERITWAVCKLRGYRSGRSYVDEWIAVVADHLEGKK